jgi:hypothetical protein
MAKSVRLQTGRLGVQVTPCPPWGRSSIGRTGGSNPLCVAGPSPAAPFPRVAQCLERQIT